MDNNKLQPEGNWFIDNLAIIIAIWAAFISIISGQFYS
jgi:hypothetical protein